jgi:DNA polymerase delta subunit 1
MPAAAKRTPMKRVLAETTNTANNIKAEPPSAKKRKLDSPAKAFRKSGTGPNGQPASQSKSRFETEVLEKLSQDIDGLKKQNQEKDQHWARPSLDDFHSERDNLVFQQIECEEGSLSGGKTTVKLFGVTQVCPSRVFNATKG